MAKRQNRPWRLAWYRPVGEFKNGERRMMWVERYTIMQYPTREAALRRTFLIILRPYVGIVYLKGRKPRRVTELQIWPDEVYSDE
jgi:hypothetical protein